MPESPYQWLHRLGAGASGEVWAARCEGRELAVAVLGEHPHADVVERAERLGARLRDLPGVVAVERVRTVDGRVHLEMPLVRGPSLARVIEGWYGRRAGPLPAGVAVALTTQVLSALHEIGRRLAPDRPGTVVHRDLSPANLLLDPTGRVRITGLGVARAELGFGSDHEDPDAPRFIAPELLAERTVDARADQFSVGAVLYALLSGRPLYPERDVAAVLSAAIRADVAPALDALDVPAPLRDVLGRMLRREPDDRFDDHRAAARALSGLALPGPTLAEMLDALLDCAPGPAPHPDDGAEDEPSEVTAALPDDQDGEPPTVVMGTDDDAPGPYTDPPTRVSTRGAVVFPPEPDTGTLVARRRDLNPLRLPRPARRLPPDGDDEPTHILSAPVVPPVRREPAPPARRPASPPRRSDVRAAVLIFGVVVLFLLVLGTLVLLVAAAAAMMTA